MLIIVLVLLDELEIKERIVISQLIYRLLGLFAIATIFTYESAILQFIEHLTQCTIARLAGCRYNLFTGHAGLFSAKSSYDLYIFFRRLKQRSIEKVKFICQFSIPGKENLIDILSKTNPLFKQVPIKRYASQYHIALSDLVPAHFKSLATGEHFALPQSKRLKSNTLRHAIMKSSMVVNHLIDNPRCSRSTYNQYNVLAG